MNLAESHVFNASAISVSIFCMDSYSAVFSICPVQLFIFQNIKRCRYCVLVSIHKYIIQSRILHHFK